MSTAAWRDANKEKMRQYRREWYNRNKDQVLSNVVGRKEKLRQWFREYKSQLKCNRCEESHVGCLDFHHENPNEKEVSISQAIRFGWSIKRIMIEMEKCEILCSNCHRKLHWQD